jgi:putative spermidine/putrescine transport system permease protein
MIRSAGPSQGADCAPKGGSAAAKSQAWGDHIMLADDAIVDAPPGGERRWAGVALVIPALVVVGLFFVVPLLLSAVGAFRSTDGGFTLAHFAKALDFYGRDLIFTVAIVVLSTLLIACVAIAIAGYLTLGENPRSVALLRWLYRWPLFIPFVVAGQIMRTFLAKNGMLNHVLIGTGLIDPLSAQSMLDWRGIVIAFVWKQAPFVTLLLAGAMASLERQHIEAARNLGAPRWRVLIDIVLPQARGTLLVGLVLSFVTMLSVLSVPLMINPNSPTMITVDVAYRISTFADYAVANALCLLSLLLAAFGAAFYLRHAVQRVEVKG